MIQTTLSGRLGKDAEVRSAGNTQVINFTVATDVGYGDKKHTLWVECAKFGDNVKVADYLTKGTQVLIIGETDLRTWESNGKTGTTLTVRVDKIELIGGRQEATNNYIYSAGKLSNKATTQPIDDLPF